MTELSGEFVWRQSRRGVWVETPIPGSDEKWMVAVLFLPHEGQIVLSELRVFPNAGRYKSVGGKPQTIRLGEREITIGPLQAAKGKGEWSRDPKDLGRVPEGIASSLLRQIPVAAIIGEVHRTAARADARDLPRGWDRAARNEPARPGKAGRSDYFYAAWAERYANEADSPRVGRRLAEKYGEKYSTIIGWVYEARNRGLLTRAGEFNQQGRAGGVLTEKARKLLATGPQPRKRGRKR